MLHALPFRPLLVAALLVLPAAASATADPLPAPSLKVFERLLGRCFVARVGKGATDTHCFEQMFGGQHLRDRHSVVIDGKPVYRGETIYSVSGEGLVFSYFNSLGGLGQGKAVAVSGGIAFSGSMRAAPASAPQSMDSAWRWQSGGGYQASDAAGPPVTFRPTAPGRSKP